MTLQNSEPTKAERHYRHKLEYQRSHPERRREYERTHRDERRTYRRQLAHQHPEKVHEYRQNYLQRYYDAEGSYTLQEFVELCTKQDWKCTYCGRERPLAPDHKIPLSRGGSNKLDNITPACKSCNSRKGSKTYDEFIGSTENRSVTKE